MPLPRQIRRYRNYAFALEAWMYFHARALHTVARFMDRNPTDVLYQLFRSGYPGAAKVLDLPMDHSWVVER